MVKHQEFNAFRNLVRFVIVWFRKERKEAEEKNRFLLFSVHSPHVRVLKNSISICMQRCETAYCLHFVCYIRRLYGIRLYFLRLFFLSIEYNWYLQWKKKRRKKCVLLLLCHPHLIIHHVSYEFRHNDRHVNGSRIVFRSSFSYSTVFFYQIFSLLLLLLQFSWWKFYNGCRFRHLPIWPWISSRAFQIISKNIRSTVSSLFFSSLIRKK